MADMSSESAPTILGWQSAADVAGVSASTLRRKVQRGELAAVQGDDGRHSLSRSDLEQIRAAASGESCFPPASRASRKYDAARAFEAFRGGLSVVDAVIDLDLDPAAAEKLYESFARLSSVQLISHKDWADLCDMLGPMEVGQLVASVAALKTAKERNDEIRFRCSDCGHPVHATRFEWARMLHKGALDGWGHDECPTVAQGASGG